MELCASGEVYGHPGDESHSVCIASTPTAVKGTAEFINPNVVPLRIFVWLAEGVKSEGH